MYSFDTTNRSNIPRSLNRICARFGCNHADHNVGTEFLVVSRETAGFGMFIGVVVVVVVWGCRSGKGRRAKEYKTRKPLGTTDEHNTAGRRFKVRREGEHKGVRRLDKWTAGKPGAGVHLLFKGVYHRWICARKGKMYTRTRRRRHANENNDPNNHDDKIYKCLFTRETAPNLPKKNKKGTRKRDVRYRCLVGLWYGCSAGVTCAPRRATSIGDSSERLISMERPNRSR